MQNTLITRFNEFSYFSSITTLGYARDNNATSFYGCTSLEQINLQNITYIAGGTGTGNVGSPLRSTALVEISIPNITKLAQYAFYNYQEGSKKQGLLERITIGDKFTTISNQYAFTYLYMASIKILTTTPATGSTLNSSGRNNNFIYVPDESVENYKSAAAWANWKNYIKPLSECPW